MVERTMAFKHYDVVRAASPSDLAEKLTHKLKEGWQPFGSPVAIRFFDDIFISFTDCHMTGILHG